MERTSKVELTIKLRHILDMITLAQHTCMYPRFPVIPEPAYPQTQTPPESISRLGYLPTGLNWSDSVIHKFTNSQIHKFPACQVHCQESGRLGSMLSLSQVGNQETLTSPSEPISFSFGLLFVMMKPVCFLLAEPCKIQNNAAVARLVMLVVICISPMPSRWWRQIHDLAKTSRNCETWW